MKEYGVADVHTHNSQEEFRRAIKNRQTSYGGKPVPIKEIVFRL